jgi:predicted dehydrogenase
VRQILRAGKSVLTEKPMVGRLDEAAELRDLAASNGLHYAVGFMKRYDFGVDRAKQVLDEVHGSGELGALLAVDSVCNGGDWTFGIEAPIRVASSVELPPLNLTYPDCCLTEVQRAQYDWLINIFSHTVNLCHHLLGGPMVVRSPTFHETRAFVATLEASDVLVSIRGTQLQSHEWREWTMLTFERGEIVIRTPMPMRRQSSAEVTVLRPANGRFVTEVHHVEPGWAFYQQAAGFVRVLAGEEELRTPAAAAVHDVAVMERIMEVAG